MFLGVRETHPITNGWCSGFSRWSNIAGVSLPFDNRTLKMNMTSYVRIANERPGYTVIDQW